MSPRKIRACVIGDWMIDRYVFGRIERLSPEAPVPVFLPQQDEQRPGGAANVTSQLQELGADVIFHHAPAPSYKTRFFVGHHPVFRMDHDVTSHPGKTDREWIASSLRETPPDVLILSDYDKGWVSDAMATTAIRAAIEKRFPVVVDPKGANWTKYQGASVICPNEKEYSDWREGASESSLVIKLGAKGLKVIQRDDPDGIPLEIPAQARHVYDVTGAGDTVVAVLAYCLAAGHTLSSAARIANLAAGYVVGEVGTTVCPLSVLEALLGGEE